MHTQDYWHHLCQRAIEQGRVWAEEYRRGVVIHGWPSRSEVRVKPENRKKRGIIKSQSARSLIRAAFAIANSPTDWEVMITLTFREKHPFPKECLRTFLEDCWPGRYGDWELCWFQEYQSRGVVHFHLLTTLDALECAVWGHSLIWETRGRGEAAREVLASSAGYALAMRWCAIIGDMSEQAVAFNLGGLAEKLKHPEDAGRYLGNYAKKLAQKTLPDDEAPNGRWWWMADACKPIRQGYGRVTHYPFDKPHRLVYDKERMRKEVSEHEPTSGIPVGEDSGCGCDGGCKCGRGLAEGTISAAERAEAGRVAVKNLLARRASDRRGE